MSRSWTAGGLLSTGAGVGTRDQGKEGLEVLRRDTGQPPDPSCDCGVGIWKQVMAGREADRSW